MADDVPSELMPALQLLDDEAVVVGVAHRTTPYQLRRTPVERQPQHGDALEALLLQDAAELGADEHQAFEPVAEGVVVRLEGARRGRDLRDAIFGEARRLAERLQGVRGAAATIELVG